MSPVLHAIERKAVCGTCVFWQLATSRSDDGYQDEGLCRRRAPSAIPSTSICSDGQDMGGEQGLLTAWPRTFSESDWCGEWKVRGEYAGRNRPQAEASA